MEEKHQDNCHKKNVFPLYLTPGLCPAKLLPTSIQSVSKILGLCFTPDPNSVLWDEMCHRRVRIHYYCTTAAEKGCVYLDFCCSTSGPALWELNKPSLGRKGGKQGNTSEVFCWKPQPETQPAVWAVTASALISHYTSDIWKCSKVAALQHGLLCSLHGETLYIEDKIFLTHHQKPRCFQLFKKKSIFTKAFERNNCP